MPVSLSANQLSVRKRMKRRFRTGRVVWFINVHHGTTQKHLPWFADFLDGSWSCYFGELLLTRTECWLRSNPFNRYFGLRTCTVSIVAACLDNFWGCVEVCLLQHQQSLGASGEAERIVWQKWRSPSLTSHLIRRSNCWGQEAIKAVEGLLMFPCFGFRSSCLVVLAVGRHFPHWGHEEWQDGGSAWQEIHESDPVGNCHGCRNFLLWRMLKQLWNSCRCWR